MNLLLFLLSFTPFYFIHHSDPQIGYTPESGPNLDSAVAQIQRMYPGPEFLLCAGDMANDPLDSALVHSQWSGTKVRFDRLTIPRFYCPGNRDIGYPSDLQGLPRMLDWYRRFWGQDYYSFDSDSCHFIVLNAILLNLTSSHILYPASLAQDSFLRRDLGNINPQNYKHLFFLYHFPTYYNTPDEANQNGNVNRPRRDTILNLIRKHHFSAVFMGHVHTDRQTLYSSALLQCGLTTCQGGLSSAGYRIVKVFEDGIETFPVYLSNPLDSVPMVKIVTPRIQPETVYVNQTVQFQVSVDTVGFPDWRGLSFRWLFGDGDSSSARNTTHIYRDTGNFYVTFTGYRNPQRAANYHLKVVVRPQSTISEEIEGVRKWSIDIPTLFKNSIELRIGSLTPVSITLYNSSGRSLYNQSLISGRLIRFKRNLPAGVYFIKLRSGSDSIIKKTVLLH